MSPEYPPTTLNNPHIPTVLTPVAKALAGFLYVVVLKEYGMGR